MKLPLLLPLVLLVPLVDAGRCPDASLIKPCNCDVIGKHSTVQCYYFDNVDELQKVFDNSYDYPFDMLVVMHSTLPYLNSTWFKAKNIQALSLYNVTLVDLFNVRVGVSAPSVYSMRMEKTEVLRGVRWQQFTPFVKLKTLTVLDSDFRKLGEEFKGNVSSSLESLTLKNARVSSFEEGQFRGMTRLSSLMFQGNRFKTLKSAYFRDLKDVLEIMDFSYNPLETLSDDLFDGMMTLRLVDLRGGKIKTLSKVGSNFKGILVLSDNPLVCDCKMSWIPGLTYYFQLDGTCEYPAFLKSKQLRHLTKEEFEACNSNNLPFDH